ncbi:MAG: hypothetical protein CMK09_09035 [Ponticaulis sp.]|nr:hypothetical protein [Ponticaulis sp.]|tara:strand:+ start:35728 stop:36288 length:561 start_codon:yes stop_codon:yes gene_type:complete
MIRKILRGLVPICLFVVCGTASAQGAVSFRTLIERFETLSPQQVAATLATLNDTERLQLSVYQSFASLVHLQACYADNSVMMAFSTGYMNCAQTYQEWQNTLYFMKNDWNAATQYAWQQRNSMLIGIKCASGEYDAGSCGAYGQGVQTYNKAIDETGKAIVRNMDPYACDNPGGYTSDGRYCAPVE